MKDFNVHCTQEMTMQEHDVPVLRGGPGFYKVVKTGPSGHNIRSCPNLRGIPIGMLVLGNKVKAVGEVWTLLATVDDLLNSPNVMQQSFTFLRCPYCFICTLVIALLNLHIFIGQLCCFSQMFPNMYVYWLSSAIITYGISSMLYLDLKMTV